MGTNNTTTILKGCIENFKKENELGSNKGEIFELFSLTQIMKDDDVSFENIMDSITDGGNDGGIDSIITLHDDEYIEGDCEYKCNKRSVTKLIITQCKMENSFKESSIDKLITTFPILFDLESSEKLNKRFNDSIIDKRNIFIKLWKDTTKNGGKLEVNINYACISNEIEITTSFKSKKAQLEALCKRLFSTDNVVLNCYSSKELLNLFQNHKEKRLTLKFKETPLSINYGDEGLGFIGLVKLADYKSFVTLEEKINDELFESNVRHFQGNVDVNKKIKATLENVSNKDFWWLNNGITIIAEEQNQAGKNLTLKHAQIVNGLQTSFSIYNLNTIQSEDDRSVLVKVIICDDKEITDEIIEATNLQNAVSPGLLRATDGIQKEIELYFLQKGYFYDRRKNYYKNQGKPGNKIFSISFLAQAIKSIILKDPHSARATPTSLLKSDTTYNSIFKAQDDFGAYLNCCIIVSKTHHALLSLDDKQQKNQLVNFKFHISMIATYFYFNSLDYNINDISNMDMDRVDKIINKDAIPKIEELIQLYQIKFPTSNLINVAKSGDFTAFIKESLK